MVLLGKWRLKWQLIQGRIQGVSWGKPEIPRKSHLAQSKTFYLTYKQSHKVLFELCLSSKPCLYFSAGVKLLKNPPGNQSSPRKKGFHRENKLNSPASQPQDRRRNSGMGLLLWSNPISASWSGAAQCPPRCFLGRKEEKH